MKEVKETYEELTVPNTFFEELDIIIETNYNFEIKDWQYLPDKNSLETYKKVNGVWAMFGEEKNKVWSCLQVAKTTDIGKEIKSDIVCLKKELISTIKEIDRVNYINQFGRKIFTHKEYIYTSVKEFVYNNIAKKYNHLIFVCVGKTDNEEEKRAMEIYFAWKTKAIYWRNGNKYREEPEFVAEDFKNREEAILNNIDCEIKRDINRRFSF